MGRVLDGFPTWSQNRDPNPDGSADPFASTSCGEECCSIVLYGLRREYTTAGQVRDAMPGHADHGETTAADLVGFLSRRGLFPLAQYVPGDGLKDLIRKGIDSTWPIIVLGNFVAPTVLHWVVVIGYGDDHALFIDPWYGRLEALHWSSFLAVCQDTVVTVMARHP